jgi:hypothetical protein
MRHAFLVTAFLLGFAMQGAATDQEDDHILYRGSDCKLETHWLFPSPLQAYFADDKHGEYPFPMVSTANYRGHVATYEIADNKLSLVKIAPSSITGMFDNDTKPEAVKAVVQKEQAKLNEILRKVFPDRTDANSPLPATWYTGHLRIFCTPEKRKYQSAEDKEAREVTEFTEIALLQIKDGAVVKEKRFPLGEYWGKFRLMQQRRDIPADEAEAITGHLEFLDSYSRDWSKIPGAETKGPLRTEADFPAFLTRQLETRVRIPLTKFVLVKDTGIPAGEEGWIIDQDLRVRPGAHLLMLEMGASNVPSGPWIAHTGGAVQVLVRLGSLKTQKLTFTEADKGMVKQINNYAGHKEGAQKLQGTLQMDVSAQGRVLLTGSIRLTSKDPTTWQEIALDKTAVPALELQDYLKTQEKEDTLLSTKAEEVYQIVLERTKAEEKAETKTK